MYVTAFNICIFTLLKNYTRVSEEWIDSNDISDVSPGVFLSLIVISKDSTQRWYPGVASENEHIRYQFFPSLVSSSWLNRDTIDLGNIPMRFLIKMQYVIKCPCQLLLWEDIINVCRTGYRHSNIWFADYISLSNLLTTIDDHVKIPLDITVTS